MPSQSILLVRHGEREDTVDSSWALSASRPHDPGLSKGGFQQAAELAAYLKKSMTVAHLFASPFLRTVQTAHVIADALKLPVKLEKGFCEWLNPIWFPQEPTFETVDVLAARYPRLSTSYTSRLLTEYPEPTPKDSAKRFGRAIRLVLPDHAGAILIVGHGATVAGVARSLDLNSPRLSVPFCSLTRLTNKSGEWKVDVADDTAFLRNGSHGSF